MERPSFLEELWGSLFGGWVFKLAVLLILVVVILGIVGALVDNPQVDTPEQPQPEELSITDRMLLDKIFAGYARLSTEYEVEVDIGVLREIFEACELQSGFLDLSTWDLLVFWTIDLVFTSDADVAEEIKQGMITEGVPPKVGLESIASVISWYEAGNSVQCPSTGEDRPTVQRSPEQ